MTQPALETNIGLLVNIDSTMSPYTPPANVACVVVDPTGGAVTIVLPLNPGDGRMLVVQNATALATAITLDGNGRTIRGAATHVLASAYASAQLVFDRDLDDWQVVAGNAAASGSIVGNGTWDGQPVQWDAGSNTWIPATFLALSSDAAASGGALNLGSNDEIRIQNFPNTGAMKVYTKDAGDVARFGDDTVLTGATILRCHSTQLIELFDQLNYRLSMSTSEIRAAQPIIGLQDALSIFAAHGGVHSGLTDVTTYTVPASEYKYLYQEVDTVLTLDCDYVWPDPTSRARGTWKIIRNTTGKNLVHKCGAAATTYTQPSPSMRLIWIEPGVIWPLT